MTESFSVGCPVVEACGVHLCHVTVRAVSQHTGEKKDVGHKKPELLTQEHQEASDKIEVSPCG